MKSISERENKEQFRGFHQVLYAITQTELKETQIILIDKEIMPPLKTQPVLRSRLNTYWLARVRTFTVVQDQGRFPLK